MTGFYERSHWHCHISPKAIFISWGPRCPGADCDGLAALMEEGAVEAIRRAEKAIERMEHARRVLESEEGGFL